MNDDTTTYYKDPSKLIYELMQDTFGLDKFTYFLGSPMNIAQDAYPICAVQSLASNNTVKGAPTGYDIVREQINIHFIKLDNGQTYADDSQDTTFRELYDQIQGRDPATGFYMTGTVMYALRTNLELTNMDTSLPTVIDHDIDINYDVARNPNEPTQIQAIITIVTEERVRVDR